MIISVSGTPGTGKTVASKMLAQKLGYDHVDLNLFCKENGLVSGYDKSRDSFEIDVEKLKEFEFEDNVVIDGHFSHYINSDVVFVLRAEPDELKKRLEQRKWLPKKIHENFEAEMMGVCSVESRELNDVTVDLDTTGNTVERTVDLLYNLVKGKKFKTKPIEWDMEKYI